MSLGSRATEFNHSVKISKRTSRAIGAAVRPPVCSPTPELASTKTANATAGGSSGYPAKPTIQA